ncbi:hypothetical protein [Actinopolyspora xinjiangensis]|uniref:hypothetical protein n=1 Tax=Actinopolyspora xinjiangensis TaxID=405564 RepID=UPI00111456CD|nr:hypothetical protein [Actinopolyspora xinjiangensis]
MLASAVVVTLSLVSPSPVQGQQEITINNDFRSNMDQNQANVDAMYGVDLWRNAPYGKEEKYRDKRYIETLAQTRVTGPWPSPQESGNYDYYLAERNHSTNKPTGQYKRISYGGPFENRSYTNKYKNKNCPTRRGSPFVIPQGVRNTLQEYDAQLRGANKGTRMDRRLVRDTATGNVFYSPDHYCTFIQVPNNLTPP